MNRLLYRRKLSFFQVTVHFLSLRFLLLWQVNLLSYIIEVPNEYEADFAVTIKVGVSRKSK